MWYFVSDVFHFSTFYTPIVTFWFTRFVRKSSKVAHKVFTLHFSYLGKSSCSFEAKLGGSSNPFNPNSAVSPQGLSLALAGSIRERHAFHTRCPGGLKGGFSAQQCPPLLGAVYF